MHVILPDEHHLSLSQRVLTPSNLVDCPTLLHPEHPNEVMGVER
jgi:hypothetical protein